jgi:uncharacterized protein
MNRLRPTSYFFFRVAAVFVAAVFVWLIVQNVVNAVYGSEYNRAAHVWRAVGVFILAVPLVLAARKLLDRDASLQPLGLGPLREARRPFLAGMAAWLIPAGIGFALCAAIGWAEVSTDASFGAIVLNVLSLLVLVFVFEAFPEELIFRGYIFHVLASRWALRTVVVGQALLFTLWGMLNGGGISVDRVALFIIFGLILGAIRAITGSVWATIGYHLAFQTVAQLFGSVGGQFVVSQALGLVAFGILPAMLALPVLRIFYKTRPDWRRPFKI